MKSSVDILILGAGISGLTAAHYLQQRGADLLVVEEAARPGGVIQTRTKGAYRYEAGPNAIMMNDSVRALINELGLQDKLQTAPDLSQNRYLYFKGKLRLLKPGPGLLTSGLLPPSALLAFLREPFVKASNKEDESIADFFLRRLNRPVLDNLINPMVAGIYAGDPAMLSLRSTFKKLYAMEQEHGSLIKAALRKKKGPVPKRELASFTGGLHTLIDKMSKNLGQRLQLSARVIKIDKQQEHYHVQVNTGGATQTIRCKRIISTLPAAVAAKVLPAIGPAVASQLNDLYYAPMLLLYLAYNKQHLGFSPDGFGFLIPQKERMPFLGAIWNSALFPGRAPHQELFSTVFVGGANRPEVVTYGEQEIAAIEQQYRQVMTIGSKPVFIDSHLQPRAIPQFPVGYHRLMEALDEFERQNPGIYISGNWRSGVAIGDCIDYNKRLVVERL